LSAPVSRVTESEPGSILQSLLGGTGDPGIPAAAPLAWATLAVSRRDPASPTASQGADPISNFIRIFIGDGTADNPNGGILIGNGYIYTAYAGACTSGACNGGNSGIIGTPGSGFNGGNAVAFKNHWHMLRLNLRHNNFYRF